MIARLDISVVPPTGAPPLILKEGEALSVTLRPLNADLAATTPATMRYYLRDMDRGVAIIGWQGLTPATAVTVVLVGSRNVIRNGRQLERRQAVFEATDSDGHIRRTLDFWIESLGLGLDGETILTESDEVIITEN